MPHTHQNAFIDAAVQIVARDIEIDPDSIQVESEVVMLSPEHYGLSESEAPAIAGFAFVMKDASGAEICAGRVQPFCQSQDMSLAINYSDTYTFCSTVLNAEKQDLMARVCANKVNTAPRSRHSQLSAAGRTNKLHISLAKDGCRFKFFIDGLNGERRVLRDVETGRVIPLDQLREGEITDADTVERRLANDPLASQPQMVA